MAPAQNLCLFIYVIVTFLDSSHHVTGYAINTNRAVPPERQIKRRLEGINTDHVGSHDVVVPGNATPHDNGNHTHVGESHDVHSKHHSIHVASWNFKYVESPFIIAVFLIFAGIAKLGFHHANFLSSKVPESCLLIILGTVVGAILYGAFPDSKRPGMTSELFFLYLLFPIILESAYSLHDRTFFENIGTVLIYAVLGTVLNCFLIGPTLYGIYAIGGMGEGMPDLRLIQCLVFSAIIVAVDPVAVLAIFQEVGVNNTLYFLVFGESLLNDAVTVVLYNMMKTLNLMEEITYDQVLLGIVQFFVVSLGGLAIGVLFGALTAIMTKYTHNCRVVEPLAVFVLAYIAYLVAEMFHLSGIISIIGCGLTQAQYAFHNISRKSYTTVKYFSKMMSATCDCVIFMFLGIALFKHEVLNINNWHPWFILYTILFCFLYRFIAVFGLTFILNKSNRIQRKIDLEEQFIMAYGGLRGAVAFSLVDVLLQENLPRGHFLTTTLVVIFFTVFIQGGTIKPLVKFLRVKMEDTSKPLLGEEINDHVTDHVLAGIEEIMGFRGQYYFRELMDYYNSHYLKVWLQRNPISTDEQIMHCYEKLALEQHFESLAGSKMIKEKYVSSTHLLENISIDSNEPVEVEEEDDTSEIFVPVPSRQSSSEDISSELDEELLHKMKRRGKRRNLFTVDIPLDVQERLRENPTAQDVRKIMVPSRRQMQYKRLNKNITSEDSEADLMQFLKEKQMRTRRASNAFFMAPSNHTSPEHTPKYNRSPRKSMVPSDITQNYRRRLSLAVPDQIGARQRGASLGNVGLTIDSPARRRLRLKRRAYSEYVEEPGDKSSDSKLNDSLATLKEHEDEEEAKVRDHEDASPNDRLLGTGYGSGDIRDKRETFKHRSSSDPERGSLKRSPPNKNIPPRRKSPSIKRKLFQSEIIEDIENDGGESINLSQKNVSKVSPLRKNTSYQRAMSLEKADDDENTNV